MLIDFAQPILDIEDRPIHEVRTNAEGQYLPARVVPTRFFHPQEAIAAGEPAANLHPGGQDGTLVRHEYDTKIIRLFDVVNAALNMQWEGEDIDHKAAFERWTLSRTLRKAEKADDLTLDLDDEDVQTMLTCTDHWHKKNRTYFARARELLTEATKAPPPKKPEPRPSRRAH